MSTSLVAAPAASATTTDPTLTAAGAQMVTESGRIVDFYKALGVGASNIPAASEPQAATLSGVLDLVAAPASTPPLPTLSAPPTTDCSNTGALVSYSQQVAAANNAIDPKATTLGQETVYMYMSHFYDLPSICSNNAAYYSKWITNDDRAVYNSYLATSNNVQLATTIPQMILNANTLAAPATSIAKFIASGPGARLGAVANIADRATAGRSLISQFQTVSTLLDANSTPEVIVSQMRANLSSTWSDTDTVDAIIGTTAALMSPTIGKALFSLGTIVISFELTGVNSFMQTAAFNAMRMSTSGRAAVRMMRSYGM